MFHYIQFVSHTSSFLLVSKPDIHPALASLDSVTEVPHQQYFFVYQAFILLHYLYKLFVYPDSKGMSSKFPSWLCELLVSCLFVCLKYYAFWQSSVRKTLIVAFVLFQFQKNHIVFLPDLGYHQAQKCHRPSLVSTLFLYFILVCVSYKFCCDQWSFRSIFIPWVCMSVHSLKDKIQYHIA